MPRGDVLWQRLQSARTAELRKLGDIFGLRDLDHKRDAVLVEELSKEIRSAAGHSVLNWFRGPHDFRYKQMLIDVADKMAPGWLPYFHWTHYTLRDSHHETEIEDAIARYSSAILEEQLRDLSDAAKQDLRREIEEDLRTLGYSQTVVSAVGAGLVGATAAQLAGPAVAYRIALRLSSGLAWARLWWAGKASARAVLGAKAGVFTLAAVPVIAWWVGSTAYRKTVPAALHLIQIRKLREVEATLG
jgi:uncharacterized protein YaaW (UPF0174 family)